jgi:ATP-dependent Clp protease ATP-binding subunit ClpX
MYDLPSMNNLERVVVDETTVETSARPLLIYSEPSEPSKAA